MGAQPAAATTAVDDPAYTFALTGEMMSQMPTDNASNGGDSEAENVFQSTTASQALKNNCSILEASGDTFPFNDQFDPADSLGLLTNPCADRGLCDDEPIHEDSSYDVGDDNKGEWDEFFGFQG